MGYREIRAEYLELARDVAFELGLGGALVTVDDVRHRFPPPAGVDPRIMGAIFKPSEWELVARVNSRRKMSHKRPVGAFRLR